MSFLQLPFAALLVLGNGYFVGAEFALVSVRRSQIEPLVAAAPEGRVPTRARRVLDGLESLPRMMAAAQFGVTVCSLTLGAVAEPALAHLLEPAFHALRLPEALVHPAGYLIALAVVSVLHLVIGEIVPKNLAMAAPERAVLWLGPPLVTFARLTHPVIAAFSAAAGTVLRLLRVEPKDEVATVFTSEELDRLVADSRQAGLLDQEQHQRLSDALGLGSRPLSDVLLGRQQLVTVGPAVTPRELAHLTARTGYSRFPVCAPESSTARSFLGYLHVKDVLELDDEERAVPAHLWRPMTTLHARFPLDDALSAMRASASHLAAVTDDSGRVLGVAALEDVLEMLVGEVHDPTHRAGPHPPDAKEPRQPGTSAPGPRGAGQPERSESRRLLTR